MLFLLLTVAFGAHNLMPGDGQRWSAIYTSGEEAEAACTENGKLLCTKAAFLGACAYENSLAAVDANTDYNSAGWFKENGAYTRGSQGAGCVFSNWAPADGSGTAHCCEPTYANSGYQGMRDIGNEFDLEQAQAYCGGTAFPSVCTVRQVRGISEDGENVDQGSVSSVYADGSVGWYAGGGQQRWDGLTGWPLARGAHCCTLDAGYQDYTIPNYGVLPETLSYVDSAYWNAETAATACVDAGYDGLCTVAQQSAAAAADAQMCVVGWALKSAGGAAYTPGYVGYDGCGTVGQWNDDYNPYNDATNEFPVAHCCKSDAPTDTGFAFPVYTTKRQVYQFSSADDAEAQCATYGDEYSLCSRGQLKAVATETFTFNGFTHQPVEDMCSLGWTKESDGASEMTWYQTQDGNGNGCGTANTWMTIPNAQVATYHCCQAFEASDIPTPVYETLQWAYMDKASAEASCRSGMDLCTRDQLAMLARGDVTHNGQTQEQLSNMCSQGWTKDAGLGWWQFDEVAGCMPYGSDNLNAFTATTGTYHCCADFAAPSSTRPYETRQWFYYTYEEAANMCGTGAQLCTQEQVYKVASEGVTYDGMTVEAQENLCSQGWFFDGTMGWWQVIEGCGDTEAGTLASFGAETATFHCCLPFEGKEIPTPTEAPEATDAPADSVPPTAMQTSAPVDTDVSGNLPSAQDQPEGCVSYDWAPEGFENEVSYCVSDGVVFLDGYSTCVLTANGDVDEALQNSWNNDWYFGANQDCTGRSDDATTDDQLWVTNKMCDNLEADIDAVESSIDSYMDTWKSDVTLLVNQNMANFDQATQDALTDLLNQMNGGN